MHICVSGHQCAIMHYNDVMMSTMASQITSITIVYSTVYSDADQRKHQSSASLAFVLGIHRGPVNSQHKWPVTRKMFPFDDVIMVWHTFRHAMHWGMVPHRTTVDWWPNLIFWYPQPYNSLTKRESLLFTVTSYMYIWHTLSYAIFIGPVYPENRCGLMADILICISTLCTRHASKLLYAYNVHPVSSYKHTSLQRCILASFHWQVIYITPH